uniref:Uncharacterized protein n=1 Tax=Anguilla anguilla TaxID=7936 RepID=A0A0E9XDR3_ANGAN
MWAPGVCLMECTGINCHIMQHASNEINYLKLTLIGNKLSKEPQPKFCIFMYWYSPAWVFISKC